MCDIASPRILSATRPKDTPHPNHQIPFTAMITNAHAAISATLPSIIIGVVGEKFG